MREIMDSSIEEKIKKSFLKLEELLQSSSGKRNDKDHYSTLFVYLSKEVMGEFRKICSEKKLEHSEIIEELVKDWIAKNAE